MQINISKFPAHFSLVKSSVLVASMAFLASCGGAGGNSSPNASPTVAIPAQLSAIELDEVIINAETSDVDGSIANINWTQTQGSTVSLQGDSTNHLTFVAPSSEQLQELVFSVTVTDNSGATASDEVVVTVEPSLPLDELAFADNDFALCLSEYSSNMQWSRVASVTSLDCSDRWLIAIDGVEQLKNLQSLNVAGNYITDVSAIGELEHLTALDIGNNPLSRAQIELVTNNKSWHRLGLAALYLHDVSALAGMDELQRLNIASNSLADIQAISALSNLRFIDIADNNVVDIGFIEQLPLLEGVNINRNPVVDLSPMTNRSDWVELYLAQSSVNSIDFVVNSPNLLVLDISHTGIDDISPLASLSKLERLGISSLPITQLSSISELTTLKYIDAGNLTNMPAGQYANLSNLVSLEHLDLSTDYPWENQFNDLAHLAALVNLKWLKFTAKIDYADMLLLANFQTLANFAQLSYLDIQFDFDFYGQTSHYDLNVFKSMPNLKHLKLGSIENSQLQIIAENLQDLHSLEFRASDSFSGFAPETFNSLRSLKVNQWINPSGGAYISGLANLRELHIGADDDVNLALFANLTRLRALEIIDWHGGIELTNRLDFVGQLNQLRHLHSAGVIYDFNAVAQDLNNLISFKTSYNKLDSDALKKMTSLRHLAMHSEPLGNTDFLMHMPNLLSLRLESTDVTQLSKLDHVPMLVSLVIQHENISNFSEVALLDNLKHLNLAWNELSDISFIANLSGLTSLNLDYNQFSDISALTELDALHTLNLASNKIVDLTPLNNKPWLSEVELSANLLTSLESLFTLPYLYKARLYDLGNGLCDDFARLEQTIYRLEYNDWVCGK